MINLKSKLLTYSLIALFAIGCSSDPCEEPLNLECLTGDADNDGIINSDDTAPLDPCLPNDNLACPSGDLDNDGIVNSLDSDPEDLCLPNVPALELNIIGTWSYSFNQSIEFLDDGTYKSIGSEFIPIPSGEIVHRLWFVDDESTLTFEISDAKGPAFRFDLLVISNDCDQVILENNNSQRIFTRLD